MSTRRKRWWPIPEPGDIVWCHFLENVGLEPSIKPRPALIIKIIEDFNPEILVEVAYGTSQKIDQLVSGEFLISEKEHAAYLYGWPKLFNQI